MNEMLTVGMGLLGGLAIFLYGMGPMSSNLQAVAGDRMRAILGAVTRNPVMGVLAGALATAVLQSTPAAAKTARERLASLWFFMSVSSVFFHWFGTHGGGRTPAPRYIVMSL